MKRHALAGLTAFAVAGYAAADQVAQPASVAPAPLQYETYYNQPVDTLPSVAPPNPASSSDVTYGVTPSSGYEPSCLAEPNCAVEPNCAAEPSCGIEDACCGDACGCGSTCGLGGCLLGDCCLGDPWTLDSYLDPCDSCDWTVAGWMQFGYSSANDGVFNTHPDHFDAQQMYLYAEKVADGSCGWGFGGRVDVLYGTDAQNTQSFGNNPGNFDYQNGWDHGVYGWAMPQLYAEAAYGDLSVKVGHFYTLLGYQVVPATGNFFYSIPYTFNFSEAFTHTGALATYNASDELTLYGGWTAGWDTGFDQFGGGSSFLGGASVQATDDVAVTYILTAGDLGWIGNNGYTHSIVAIADLSDKMQYVFQSDVVGVDNSVNANGGHYDTIGINQYLFYTFNDCWKAGARVEWWKADGVSVNEMAYGLNYRPMANVLLRPEIRYNWSPSDNLPNVLTALGQDQAYLNQTIFAMDLILTF